MDLTSKLMEAFRRREHIFSDSENTAFRLCNGVGDGVDGITIDIYDRFILVQFFDDKLFMEKATINAAISDAVDKSRLPVDGILLKNRIRVRDSENIASIRESELMVGSLPPARYPVVQNGVKVYVDLLKGQNTGLFLDMRKVRDMLKDIYSDGGSMCNFFSYTGQFSVHALKNGMDSAVNVDLSRTVLRRARDNYRLNDLPVDDRDFVYGDAIEWMKMFSKKQKAFSFVVFDPPTFARNKKKTFSVQQDFGRTVPHLAGLCEGGYVLTSINSASISEEEFRSFHPASWDLVFIANEPDDFPWEDKPYLKVGLWRPKT
jgi:23S rRNA (cytosine1962-C5)-methyltransferase